MNVMNEMQILAETRETPRTPALHFHRVVIAKTNKKKTATSQTWRLTLPRNSCAGLISTASLEVCVCVCLDVLVHGW